MQQSKSTVIPPFNPNPFRVTSLKGNQVTIQQNQQIFKRDKNKLKILSERPKYLTPSWSKEQHHTSQYNDFEIEGNIPYSSHKTHYSLKAITEKQKQTSTTTERNSNLPASTSNLFTLDGAETSKMRSLFNSAIQSS